MHLTHSGGRGNTSDWPPSPQSRFRPQSVQGAWIQLSKGQNSLMKPLVLHVLFLLLALLTMPLLLCLHHLFI
ncbi:hypothetical protein CHARACLAT_027308 [Characodon lateralis]|uniref:Uncharacterized protein n=1 Tax=Characodon lateralis TaxID=208331 RepID=A0ABU7E3Y3_9TELE|nr:hypothetical protein [Characodon lateralis]